MFLRRRPVSWLLLGLASQLMVMGCKSGGALETIDVRHVPAASGEPSIARVVDIGSGSVPQGPLDRAGSEGHAVIGEMVVIRGRGFGKQPRITIAGRAAEVLAHVRGGGVVVRVPWGIDPGDVEIEVSHPGGRTATTFPVVRMGLVLTDEGLIPFSVKADGAASLIGQKMPLTGGEKLSFSHDGSVAYVGGVVGGKVKLWIVDLTGPAPRVVSDQSLPGSRLVGVETAAQSVMGVVVTDSHLVYFDGSQMLNPAFYAPHALPRELVDKQVLAAAIGGQGRRVALLLNDLNQVALIDASKPTTLAPAVLADVLPDARLQVVTDLRFSADGRSIWVVSSDTARSISGGYQPARMTMLRIGSSATSLPVHKTWELGDKFATGMLALARGEPIPPGTAIRDEPSSSAVYTVVHASDLLKQGFQQLLKHSGAAQGKVIRSSLSQQSPETVVQGPYLLTSVDVVGQTEILLALGCRAKGASLSRVLLHGKAWRGDPPQALDLGPAPPKVLEQSPPWIGMVRAQP